jgi:hypothetical protein
MNVFYMNCYYVLVLHYKCKNDEEVIATTIRSQISKYIYYFYTCSGLIVQKKQKGWIDTNIRRGR